MAIQSNALQIPARRKTPSVFKLIIPAFTAGLLSLGLLATLPRGINSALAALVIQTQKSIGQINNRFYVTYGGAEVAGRPINGVDAVVVTTNNPPTLTWQAGSCRTEGVSPPTGAVGAEYEFLVNYIDADNVCPASGSRDIQVWVDLDGNGYAAGEKHNLTEVSAADADCTDGKLYSITITINSAGDFNYRFQASDGVDDAYGDPSANRVVSVINAIKVRKSGGNGWQTSVQAGVDVSSNGDTILVYPKSDFTAETYFEDVLINTFENDRTLRAVCGPDLTIVDGSSNAIATAHNSNIVIDGFTLTGASDGVDVNDTSPLTIQNCKIHGNSRAINSYDSRSDLIVSNCEIYNNTVLGSDGAGIHFNSGTHHINSTTFTNNRARNGGAINCQFGCQVTIDDSVINENTGTSAGGAIYINGGGSKAIVIDTYIQGNDSGSNGGGGIYIENGGSADLTNAILTGNRTTGLGGAVNERGYASYLFCTMSGNYASSGGGAIYHLDSTVTTIQNSIIYNNGAGYGGPANKDYQILTNNHRWSAVDVYNTLINQAPSTGSWPNVAGYQDMGGNNIFEPPDFVNGLNPSVSPTTGGDYHIQSWSACVNTAGASYTYDHDIDGGARPHDGGYDMGADENGSTKDQGTVNNNVPVLAWIGEANYTNDGVDPDNAVSGSLFEFRVVYTDADNDAPKLLQVWVDENDDNTYTADEKHTITTILNPDGDYTNGETLTRSLTIFDPGVGDGIINYRFYARDYADNATGMPTSNRTITFTALSDLTIGKSVDPIIAAAPGDAITYTLVFSNAGRETATGVVLTDTIPASVTTTSVISSGVAITDTDAVQSYVWNIQDLAPGEGGTITITGQVSNSLTVGQTFTNTVAIATTSDEIHTTNNSSTAEIFVAAGIEKLCGVNQGNSYIFHPTTVPLTITVTNLGDIECLSVTRVDANHPYATTGIQTGTYWRIDATTSSGEAASGFTVTLTIEPNFVPDSDDKLCRYTGTGQVWDCAADSFDIAAQTITRDNITQLSDWAAGNDVTPATLSLMSFASRSEKQILTPVFVVVSFVMPVTLLILKRRNHK